jgi:hypothetical protein
MMQTYKQGTLTGTSKATRDPSGQVISRLVDFPGGRVWRMAVLVNLDHAERAKLLMPVAQFSNVAGQAEDRANNSVG